MATHDYDIANQSGAAFRTDLNNALAAIQSNNSNSSSPATTVAYQWWADTTSGTLKIRNSSNNAWIELLQLDGTLTLEDGSASTPALAFRDDLNTGIFSAAADEFNIATGGVERVTLSSGATVFNQGGSDTDFRIESDTKTHMFFIDSGNNRIGINSSSPTAMFQIIDTAVGGDGVIEMFRLQGGGNNNGDGGQLSFARSGVGITAAIQAIKQETAANETELVFKNMTLSSLTEKARIDGQGRLLVGTSSTDDYDGFNSSLQVTGATGDASSVTISRFSNNNSGANLILAKSRTGTIGNNAVLTAGDQIANIQFHGNDGSGFHDAAIIRAEVASGVGNDDMPADLAFLTNGGTTGVTEQMRLTSGGKLLVGTSSSAEVASSVASTLQVKIGSSGIPASFYSTVDGIGPSGVIALGHGRGSIGGALQDNDLLGQIRFAGGDGTDCQTQGATINAEVNGTPSSNNMPTDLVFSTNSGASSVSERLRIKKDGDIVKTVVNNMTFRMDQTAANNNKFHNFMYSRSASSRGDCSVIAIGEGASSQGNIKIRTSGSNAAISGGVELINGNTAFSAISDIRLKNIISNITDALTNIDKIEPIKYSWKYDKEDIPHIGVSAQSVEKVYPELIELTRSSTDESDETDYLSVLHTELIPVCIAAIKELKAKVETLETKVETLEAA